MLPFMLPKRRVWKKKQKNGRVFSRSSFARVWELDLGQTATHHLFRPSPFRTRLTLFQLGFVVNTSLSKNRDEWQTADFWRQTFAQCKENTRPFFCSVFQNLRLGQTHATPPLFWTISILPLPNEDLGRPNKHFRTHFPREALFKGVSTGFGLQNV